MIYINMMSKGLSSVLRARRWREQDPERSLVCARNCYTKHRESRKARMRSAYAADPKKYRDSNRRSRFGKTAPEHLQEQVEKQNNLCAICKQPFIQAPCLDHNHETKQMRGALCGGCNRGLGNFSENIDALRRAIDYLVGWEECKATSS